MNRLTSAWACARGATEVITQVPPLAVSASAGSSSSPRMTPKVQITESHIWPQVSAPTPAMASSSEAKAWVAPNRWACSRLNSTGSTAMIRRAPATRAPWTALMPTPPMPRTATVSPGRTPARLTAEPREPRDRLVPDPVRDAAVGDYPGVEQLHAQVAQVSLAAQARRARAAGRDERHRHVVTGRHRGHAGADLRDLAGALVTVDDRVVR